MPRFTALRPVTVLEWLPSWCVGSTPFLAEPEEPQLHVSPAMRHGLPGTYADFP